MESVFAEQQALQAAYLTDKPKQRYAKLVQQRLELFQLVPQYQIASYVGVAPESLSFIRRRLSAKSNAKTTSG
jgi:hypothetical protein